MYESLNDAIALLKKDHDKVKELLDRFEEENNQHTKKEIVTETIQKLRIHSAIEEEIFYPAVRRQLAEKNMLNAADEKRYAAKLLIAELDQLNGSEKHFDAKFKVLAENIRHHIREEEDKIMPAARRTDINFASLGEHLLARKQELMLNGVPSTEEKMISRYRARADFPMRDARRKQIAKTDRRKSVNRNSHKKIKVQAAKVLRKHKTG